LPPAQGRAIISPSTEGVAEMKKVANVVFALVAMTFMMGALTYAWAYGDDKMVWHQANGCQNGTTHVSLKLEGTCERKVAEHVTEIRNIKDLPVFKQYHLLMSALSPK